MSTLKSSNLNPKESKRCKIPASIESYKLYGIPKSMLLHLLKEFPAFPPNFQDTLESYYLLYWEPHYFLSQIKEGTLTHNGKVFQVIYKRGASPATIKSKEQIKLSFRAPKAEFDLPSYVLVTLSNQKDLL